MLPTKETHVPISVSAVGLLVTFKVCMDSEGLVQGAVNGCVGWEGGGEMPMHGGSS